jgi:RNA polymerase sigma-70 factor, ECF subfamily
MSRAAPASARPARPKAVPSSNPAPGPSLARDVSCHSGDREIPQRSSGPAHMPGVPDSDLVARLVEGDEEAFARLVAEHGPAARRLARLVLRDANDADDAVQDGLLAAWRSIARFDPRRPFRPWLMRIVLNAARDLRRRRTVRQTQVLAGDEASREASPDRQAGRALLRARLQEALATLPERARVAVTLFDAEGYSHGEIAELLDVPEGTVRSDVFHARRNLRVLLAPFLEEVG